MGYTHYWDKAGPWPAEALAAAIKDMSEIVARCEFQLGDAFGEPGTLPELTPDTVAFNGVGEDSHETFYFTSNIDPRLGIGGGERRDGFIWYSDFAFCKTDRKPYDSVVVACLLAAKHHLGAAIKVSSDGRWNEEWKLGTCRNMPSGRTLYEHIFPERAPVSNPTRR